MIKGETARQGWGGAPWESTSCMYMALGSIREFDFGGLLSDNKSQTVTTSISKGKPNFSPISLPPHLVKLYDLCYLTSQFAMCSFIN
jgi:hypothetical protein